MIREAIANWINAKAEKIRHVHKWEVIQEGIGYEYYEGLGKRPQQKFFLMECKGCGDHKQVTIGSR